MLAYSFNRQFVAILEAFLDVVGREGCKFTCIQNVLLAQGQDVGVGPEDDSEIAHERAHSSGRLLPGMLNVEFPVFALDYARARQAFFKPCRYSYRAASRTASSVRGRECLVKIQVHDVESHVSRTNDSQQRVHVSSVIIQKASTCMYQVSYLSDFAFKQSERVRVCHHYSGNLIIEQRFQVLHINKAVFL